MLRAVRRAKSNFVFLFIDTEICFYWFSITAIRMKCLIEVNGRQIFVTRIVKKIGREEECEECLIDGKGMDFIKY